MGRSKRLQGRISEALGALNEFAAEEIADEPAKESNRCGGTMGTFAQRLEGRLGSRSECYFGKGGEGDGTDIMFRFGGAFYMANIVPRDDEPSYAKVDICIRNGEERNIPENRRDKIEAAALAAAKRLGVEL